jgi:hypothetical protein
VNSRVILFPSYLQFLTVFPFTLKFRYGFFQYLTPFYKLKLHNEELNDLYSLPNIVWVVKSRRMRWAGHVACMGEGRVVLGMAGERHGHGMLCVNRPLMACIRLV